MKWSTLIVRSWVGIGKERLLPSIGMYVVDDLWKSQVTTWIPDTMYYLSIQCTNADKSCEHESSTASYEGI